MFQSNYTILIFNCLYDNEQFCLTVDCVAKHVIILLAAKMFHCLRKGRHAVYSIHTRALSLAL